MFSFFLSCYLLRNLRNKLFQFSQRIVAALMRRWRFIVQLSLSRNLNDFKICVVSCLVAIAKNAFKLFRETTNNWPCLTITICIVYVLKIQLSSLDGILFRIELETKENNNKSAFSLLTSSGRSLFSSLT